MSSPDETRKLLATAGDALILRILSDRAPVDCPERSAIQIISLSIFTETGVVVFNCPGHADMPVCRECKIKGSFQMGTPRGKNVM